MKLPIKEELVLPEGITASLSDGVLTVKGPKGEVSRSLLHPKIDVSLKGNTLTLFCERGTKREKNIMFTFVAHINNMIKGVQEPFVFKLKVCSGHFPMTVAYKNDQFEVKNFLGEKYPRIIKIKKGADVKISGQDIVVTSVDLELAGGIASDIEGMTKKGTRDTRRFQDGIYITEKPTRR
ncbi:50S ribosomal protein L6 [Candidatus Woesearchaeota archaeon]|nr:50S ribosomal protein L6 [Candidatus Woesearchaeota archaeon]